jgi:hypothetical protein
MARDLQHADGSVERVRKRSPVQSKAGADEFEHQLRTALFSAVKHRLLPVFGEMRLDAIKMHAIEILKADLLAKGSVASA